MAKLGRIVFRVWLEIEESEIVMVYYLVTETFSEMSTEYKYTLLSHEIAYPFIDRSILGKRYYVKRQQSTIYNVKEINISNF